MNPIENVWHELKYFIRTVVKPVNKEELFAGIQLAVLGNYDSRKMLQINKPFKISTA